MLFPKGYVPYASQESAVLTNLEDFLAEEPIKTRLDCGTVMVRANIQSTERRSINYMRQSRQDDPGASFMGLLYVAERHWIKTLPKHFRLQLHGGDNPGDFLFPLPEGADPSTLGVFKLDSKDRVNVPGNYNLMVGTESINVRGSIPKMTVDDTVGATLSWNFASNLPGGGSTEYDRRTIVFCLRKRENTQELTFSPGDRVEIRYQYKLTSEQNYRIFATPKSHYTILSDAIRLRDSNRYKSQYGHTKYNSSTRQYGPRTQYDPRTGLQQQVGVEKVQFKYISAVNSLRITNYDTSVGYKEGDLLRPHKEGRLTLGTPNNHIPNARVIQPPRWFKGDDASSLEISF